MSDQPICTNVNNPIDNAVALMSSSSPPRKKLKLTQNKTRTLCLLPEKMHAPLSNYSWKFIDKNETMMAELSGGKLTLWQFLLELLMSEEYSNLIKWTDRNIGEFILIQAEEVAKLWGIRKDRNHRMNYDKLSRALRYYYQKNIIKKVHGHKFVYRFVSLLPEMIPGSSYPFKSITHCDSIHPNQQASIMADGEPASMDHCKSRSICYNRSQQSISNPARIPNKNFKKSDFNSTLSALFQAALLSLSGCNNDLSPGMFAGHKESETGIYPSDDNRNTPSGSRGFESVGGQTSSSPHQECMCKPEQSVPSNSSTSSGLFIPGSGCSAASQAPFDRQSLLHFSRHFINMQRLSQEILLHSCNNSKPLLKPHLQNSLLNSPPTESLDNIIDSSHPTYWLNQFAKNLCSSSSTNNHINSHDDAEMKIKAEKSNSSMPPTAPETGGGSNSLTILFQQFVKDLEEKKRPVAEATVESNSSGNGSHVSEYSHSDLANLIKSQLETQSSFIWMPISAKFAEEIMKYCIRSDSTETTGLT